MNSRWTSYRTENAAFIPCEPGDADEFPCEIQFSFEDVDSSRRALERAPQELAARLRLVNSGASSVSGKERFHVVFEGNLTGAQFKEFILLQDEHGGQIWEAFSRGAPEFDGSSASSELPEETESEGEEKSERPVEECMESREPIPDEFFHPSSCFSCQGELGEDSSEYWDTIRFMDRKVRVPRCAGCANAHKLSTRLKNVFRFGASKSKGAPRCSEKDLIEKYSFFRTLEKKIRDNEELISREQKRIFDREYSIDRAQKKPGQTCRIQAVAPNSWPDAWKDFLVKSSAIESKNRQDYDQAIAEKLKEYSRELEGDEEATPDRPVIEYLPLFFHAHAQLAGIDAMIKALEEAEDALPLFDRFLEAFSPERKKCVFCRFTDPEATGFRAALVYQITPSLFDLYSRVKGSSLGATGEFLASVEKSIQGDLDRLEANDRELIMEQLIAPARIATVQAVVGRPVDLAVCQFCNAKPIFEKSGDSEAPVLGRATLVHESLWLAPLQRFEREPLQRTLCSETGMEIRNSPI